MIRRKRVGKTYNWTSVSGSRVIILNGSNVEPLKCERSLRCRDYYQLVSFYFTKNTITHTHT